jgi:hypothetical protein
LPNNRAAEPFSWYAESCGILNIVKYPWQSRGLTSLSYYLNSIGMGRVLLAHLKLLDIFPIRYTPK